MVGEHAAEELAYIVVQEGDLVADFDRFFRQAFAQERAVADQHHEIRGAVDGLDRADLDVADDEAAGPVDDGIEEYALRSLAVAQFIQDDFALKFFAAA